MHVAVTSEILVSLMLIFWSRSIQAVFPQGVPDSRCSVDFGMLADQGDCQRYLVCRYGKVDKHYSCINDMMYDPASRLCDYPERVDCGQRMKAENATTGCYVSNINMTVHVENRLVDPHFQYSVDMEVPRVALSFVLLMASGKIKDFRYETAKVEPFGEFITSVNGVRGEYANRTLWMIWSSGFPIEPPDLRKIYPSDGDHILLRFQHYIGQTE